MPRTTLPFEAAVDALIQGDEASFSRLLAQYPDLALARSPRAHQATLLHYAAANAVEAERQITPPNILRLTEILLKAGAEVDALAPFGGEWGPGSTPLVSVLTSVHPYRVGLQTALAECLLDAGAAIDGVEGRSLPLGCCLAFGYTESAQMLLRRGAYVPGLVLNAGLGRLAEVKAFFQKNGQLKPEAFAYQEAFLKPGTDPQNNLNWAFVYACMHQQLEVAAYLLEQGAEIGAHGHEGMTALHYAVARAHQGVVDFLLAREAPLESLNRYGGTVLDYLAWLWTQSTGPLPEHPSIFFQLLLAGARPEGVTPFPTGDDFLDQELTFFRALRVFESGDVASLKSLLQASPGLVHYRTECPLPPFDGYFYRPTLLHFCAGNPAPKYLPARLLEIVDCLLAQGADVDARSGKSAHWAWTPLGLVTSSATALQQGFTSALIDRLLVAGADIQADQGLVMYGAFFHTVEYQPLREVAEMLYARGAQVDLGYAAAVGDLVRVKQFFDPAGNLSADAYSLYRPADNRLQAPTRVEVLTEALVFAALTGRLQVAEYLLEQGASLNGTAALHGERPTALQAAIWANWGEMARWLVSQGSDLMQEDPVHQSHALGWAEYLGREAIAEYLRPFY